MTFDFVGGVCEALCGVLKGLGTRKQGERREEREVEKKIRTSWTVIGKILLYIKTGHCSSSKELFFWFIVDNRVDSKLSKCRVSSLCDTTRIIRMCMLCRCCICLT